MMLLTAAIFALQPIDCSAGDWPQILGPQRNGIAADEQVSHQWPGGMPATLWERPAGAGFAGVAVAGGRLVLFHRQGNQELVECLQADSGKPLWKRAFETLYVSTISPDNGPRSVPVVHQGRVYAFGAGSDLHCLALADGKTLWSRDLAADFDIPDSYFGAGSTPIVVEDKLLVNVGGRDGAGIVAFSADSGKTLWKATDDAASYSSPVAATLGGVAQVVFITRLNTYGISPADGKLLFQVPFGRRGPTVNAANPVILNGHVFLTASYGLGAMLVRVDGRQTDIVWENDSTLSSQYTTPIHHGGHLYGIDGRQDIGEASLRCIEPKSGRVVWSEDNFGYATLILAGDKLLIQKTDGELVVAAATPTGFKKLAAAQVIDGTSRALPALADGKYYVRNEDTLKCIDLAD